VQVSKVLLLTMFSLASRYVDPPPEQTNQKMWEVGCNYILDAREVLSESSAAHPASITYQWHR
jgi:hypothetical protein